MPRPTALCLLLLCVACDGAQDGQYRGELELAFDGELRFRQPDDDPRSLDALTAALIWGAPDGDVVRVDPVAFTCGLAQECRVEVFSRPPRAALRDARRGRYALGELVLFHDLDRDKSWDPNESDGSGEAIVGRVGLVVFATDAVSDDLFNAPIAEGMHLLDAMAPCQSAEAAGSQRFVLATPGELRTVRLTRRPSASYVGGEPHYFDPLCAERLLASPETDCPRLDVTRWLCRNEDPDADLCPRCEYQVFPVQASPNDCALWRSRWDTHVRDPGLNRGLSEVLAETRLCNAREPSVAAPCDQACVCTKRHDYCRDVEGRPPLDCADERAACLAF